MYRLRKAARSVLVGAGYNEAVTYVTIGRQDIDRFSDRDRSESSSTSCGDNLVELRNALQADRNLMRPTLIPSLLDVLSANLKHETGVRLRGDRARLHADAQIKCSRTKSRSSASCAAGRAEPLGLRARASEPIDFFELKGDDHRSPGSARRDQHRRIAMDASRVPSRAGRADRCGRHGRCQIWASSIPIPPRRTGSKMRAQWPAKSTSRRP